MHEWNGAEIPAVILALVVVFVSVGSLVHLLRTRAARRVEILQIQRLLAEEERLVAEAEAEGYANSVIENRRLCSLCQATTNTRCSRCKRVYYCSRSCQVLHWKQGHKDECQIQEKDYEMSDAQNDEMKPQKEVEVEQPQKEVEVEHVAEIHNEEIVKEEIENKPRMKSKVHQSEDAAYLHANVHLQDNAHLSNRGFQGNGSDVRNKAALEQHTGTINNGHPRAQHAGISSKLRAQKSYKILYPYEDFKQFYSWDELEYPCGLINGGNSCFANVVLQCLTYTRPLAAYLLDGSHRQECQREDWCFMCELNYHVHSVCSSKDPFSPVRILSRMKDIGSHLGYGMQEDAHEFMRLAVSLMQKICLDEAGGEKLLDHRSQETTFIQYVFGGRLQSQVSCLQCHQKSKRYENMMDLTVEIEGAESLEDALAQFTAAELLDGENRYKCDRCNEYVNAEKRLTLYEAPNILTIALKRFQSGKFGKLNKNVSFPETLDLYQFMSREVDRPPSYKLYAVIVHVDTSNASFFGHYICYVKDRNGIWYKIDDSKVKSVDRSVVLSEKAYMLFYSRPYARPLLLLDQASTSSASQTSYWAAKTTSLSRSSSNHIFHPEMSRLDTPEKSINGIHFLNATPSRPLLCSWTEAKCTQFVTFTDVDKILEESPKEYYGISDRPSNRPPLLYNSSVKHFDVNHGSSGNLEIVPLRPKRRLDSRLLRDEYNSQDKVSCSGKSLKKQHNSLVLKDVFQGMDEFCGQSSGSSHNGFLRESYSLEDMDVFRNNVVAHEDHIMDVPPWFLESSNVKPPLRRVKFSATRDVRDVGASENANVPTDNMLPCRTVADIASASDASSNLTRASTS